jgi:hypothetical protein
MKSAGGDNVTAREESLNGLAEPGGILITRPGEFQERTARPRVAAEGLQQSVSQRWTGLQRRPELCRRRWLAKEADERWHQVGGDAWQSPFECGQVRHGVRQPPLPHMKVGEEETGGGCPRVEADGGFQQQLGRMEIARLHPRRCGDPQRLWRQRCCSCAVFHRSEVFWRRPPTLPRGDADAGQCLGEEGVRMTGPNAKRLLRIIAADDRVTHGLNSQQRDKGQANPSRPAVLGPPWCRHQPWWCGIMAIFSRWPPSLP